MAPIAMDAAMTAAAAQLEASTSRSWIADDGRSGGRKVKRVNSVGNSSASTVVRFDIRLVCASSKASASFSAFARRAEASILSPSSVPGASMLTGAGSGVMRATIYGYTSKVRNSGGGPPLQQPAMGRKGWQNTDIQDRQVITGDQRRRTA